MAQEVYLAQDRTNAHLRAGHSPALGQDIYLAQDRTNACPRAGKCPALGQVNGVGLPSTILPVLERVFYLPQTR